MKRGQLLLAVTIAFVVLYLAATLALGTLPAADDSGAVVVRWFRDNGTHVHLSMLFLTFGLVAVAAYVALVRSALPPVFRDVWFVGGIVLIAETVVQAWLIGALALHPGTLQPATARSVLDIASYWGPMLTGATITMLLPIVILGFRRLPGIPTWLAVLAFVAVVEQAIETITIFGSKGFTAPGGPMNLQLGAGLVTLTFVCLGVTMSRRMDNELAETG